MEDGVVRHRLATSRSLVDIHAGFHDSLKRNLRKADRAGLNFERRDDLDAMDVFYRLHTMTRKKLGVPVQPKSFFHRFHHWIVAKGLGYIAIVTDKQRPVAAGVYLTYGDTAIYKYGASDAEALACRPNEYMMYHAIRIAVESGQSHFDFGTSRLQDTGLRRFKKKWGSTELGRPAEYLTGSIPAAQDSSWMMTVASSVIRRSPTLVCRSLGEMFYRFSK